MKRGLESLTNRKRITHNVKSIAQVMINKIDREFSAVATKVWR